MQQTNQYKLNLIENGDQFSPAPLNENAQKVEAVLAGIQQQVALAGNCKKMIGSYIGTGGYGNESANTLTFSEAPQLVFVFRKQDSFFAVLIPGVTKGILFNGSSLSAYTTIWSNDNKTVKWFCSTNAGYQLNEQSVTYQYFAFA
jgi:hypothetical protein